MIDWMRLIYPPAWVQLYKRSEEWDGILNKLMDKHEPVRINEQTVRLGPVDV